jgi:phosphatidylglycerophosphatase A
VPPALVFGLLLHFGGSAPVAAAVMGVLVFVGSVACVAGAPAAIAALGKLDPGEVVADEFAGQALAYLVVPFFLPAELSLKQCCLVTAAGFVLFRLFDIAKPWPIRKLEKLPAGWGILADDLLAGVFAAVVLIVLVKLLIAGRAAQV